MSELSPSDVQYLQGGESVPSANPAQDPPDLTGFPLWQLKYLAALQAGATDSEALETANVSEGTINRYLAGDRASPAFARALARVVEGVQVLGVPQARALAQADMPNLVGHWAHKARHAEYDRDQVAFGRLVADVAGATDRTASASASPVQIQIVVVGADEVRARKAPPSP